MLFRATLALVALWAVVGPSTGVQARALRADSRPSLPLPQLDASYAARLASAAGEAATAALPKVKAAAEAVAPAGFASAGTPGFNKSALRLSPNDVGALTQTLQTVQTMKTFLENLPAVAANASAAGAAGGGAGGGATAGAATTPGVFQTAPGPAGQFSVGSPTAAATFSAGSAPVPPQAAAAAATLVKAFTPTLERATSFLQGVLPSPPPPPAAPAGTNGQAAGAAVASRLNALFQGDLDKAAGWENAPAVGADGTPVAAGGAGAAAPAASASAPLPPLPAAGTMTAAGAASTASSVTQTKMSTDAFGRRRLLADPASAAAPAPAKQPTLLELPPLPALPRPPALPPASSLPNPATAPRPTPRAPPRPPAGPPGAAASAAAALNSLSAAGAAGVAAFAPSLAPALGDAPIRGVISFAAPPALSAAGGGATATPSLPAIRIPSAAGVVALPALPLPSPDQLSLAALNPKGDLIWTNPGGAGKGGAAGMTSSSAASGDQPAIPGAPAG